MKMQKFNRIYACGPEPMLKSVAKFAKNNDIICELSLENLMACGIGACLCCVNKEITGTKTVCVDGPIFDANTLNF
jgi:dihydroorotate dehydrogenase electron transfer subunit